MAMMKTEMKREENSSVYPRSQTAIDSIAANMKAHGFDPNFPILVRGKEIVDGWHRYQAALLAGVVPVFKEFDGDGIEGLLYVMRANGDRRHLDKGAKAAAAILIGRKLALLGKSTEDIVAVEASVGVSEYTFNKLRGCSDDDLQGIVSGKKTQHEVQQSRSKGASRKPDTYTLTKGQAAKVASLTITLDDRAKNVERRVFDAGLKVLEEQSAAGK